MQLSDQTYPGRDAAPVHPMTAATPTTVRTARPWRIALAAALSLLVLIAGFGNQWVTDAIDRHAGGRTFADHVVQSLAGYRWRFAPRGSSDPGHVWLADLCYVGAALALTLLLVAVVVRGRGGFGQAFVGTWTVVVVAALLAGYVRAAVVDPTALVGSPAGGKADTVFFSPLSTSTLSIAGSVLFGFVVGLVAALTAVLSRRSEALAPLVPVVPPGYEVPGAAPADPQVGGGPGVDAGREPGVDPYAARPAGDQDVDRYGAPGATEATRTLPVPDEPTTEFRREESGPRHLDG